MKLCVGAVSVRVIEEAAKLGVAQVVASRRQVDTGGGYTGLDQAELVSLVRSCSRSTEVVRDHGGPLQGPEEDDGVASLEADVTAGFDALHLDVCKLPSSVQHQALAELIGRFGDRVAFEVGGEHDDFSHNDSLFGVAVSLDALPETVVIDTGAFIMNDRQVGCLRSKARIRQLTRTYRDAGVKLKMHNADWAPARWDYARDDVLDYYNIAPEFALVETDACLRVLSLADGDDLLQLAYDSGAWARWFDPTEGTWDDRARCAVRYVMELPEVRELLTFDEKGETYVRGRVRAALAAG